VVDPSANRIAPHQPGISGLQQIGRLTHFPYPRIKPQVVAIWIKDHWEFTAYELRGSLSVGCSSRLSSVVTAIRFDFR
jgi:hypothetical protein